MTDQLRPGRRALVMQPTPAALTGAPAGWGDRLFAYAMRLVRASERQGTTDLTLAVGIAVGGMALYVATLAPTVVWGDDATLQLVAVQGRFQASAGSHPAWVLLAHLFTKLPVGELAYRVNLASAFAAALTLGLLYLIGRSLSVSRVASLGAVAAFAVSHTFWAHAVRPEVYALTLATLAFVVWAALRWHRCGQRRYLILTAAGWSLAFSTHVLALLYLPALAFLLLAQRGRLKRVDWAWLIGAALVALAPYGFVLWSDHQRMQVGLLELVRWALFTFDGYDFSSQMAGFSLATLFNDVVQWAGFLAYQFIGLGLLGMGLGVVLAWRRWPRVPAVFIGLLYVVPALFAFAYRVGDRYVFFLPSYLPCAIWLAIGMDGGLRWLRTRGGRLQRVMTGPFAIPLVVVVLLVLIPVGVYRIVPEVVGRLGVQSRDARYVPGPNSRYFLLWPPKANYTDARDYAEAALTSAPSNALLLADPTLASPMFFLQQVERLRPDVRVRFCCWDIEQALTAETGRPVALADNAASIYPIERLEREYQITSHGPLYLLVPARSGTLLEAASGTSNGLSTP